MAAITALPISMEAKVWHDELRGCWEWVGARNSRGYGCYAILGKSQLAHRIAWEELVGPIPADLTIDHAVCRNRACINPAHLEVVTAQENIRRAAATRGGYCRSGHFIGQLGDRTPVTRRHCPRCDTRAELLVKRKAARAAVRERPIPVEVVTPELARFLEDMGREVFTAA